METVSFNDNVNVSDNNGNIWINIFSSGSGADMDTPHSHIFKCPRCGGSGKEHLKGTVLL